MLRDSLSPTSTEIQDKIPLAFHMVWSGKKKVITNLPNVTSLNQQLQIRT